MKSLLLSLGVAGLCVVLVGTVMTVIVFKRMVDEDD